MLRRLRLIGVGGSFRLESHLPHLRPDAARMFAALALELFGDPDHCAEDHGAVVVGQVHDACLDDEATEFDQMARPLAPLDLPCAHVMPRPLYLMPVARGSVASERRQRRGQALMQFAATGPERT